MNKESQKLIYGPSPTMIKVFNIVQKVAATEANILIAGENGTGKELLATEIHNRSGRAGEHMISVDMGSVPESLFESELFGHVRGAFTDARDDRKGKFELASGGTLFLDEIGNLSLHSQAKLLNALQSRTITRIGSNKEVTVDIRLVCATNRDLSAMVTEGIFREDLLYRINTIVIDLPPLRDRVDDIPILANYFLRFYCEKYNRDTIRFNTHTLEKLSNYNWPGNVRELRHAIEKAVIMSDSAVLLPTDFELRPAGKKLHHQELTLAEMESKYILECLRRYGNNLSITASKLGITRQTLYNKLRKADRNSFS